MLICEHAFCADAGSPANARAAAPSQGARYCGMVMRLTFLGRPAAALVQRPYTSKRKVPETGVGCGFGCSVVGAGAGPKSAVSMNSLWVLGSRAMLRAPNS